MAKMKEFVEAIRDLQFSIRSKEEIIELAKEIGEFYGVPRRQIKAGLKKVGVIY